MRLMLKPIDANPDAHGANPDTNCDANEEAFYERIPDMDPL